LPRFRRPPPVAYGRAPLVLVPAGLQRRGELAPRPAAGEAVRADAVRQPAAEPPPVGGAPAAKGAPPVAPATFPPGRPPTFDLRSQSITIPLPQALGAASGLEVRIRDQAGKRELLQRVDAPAPGG